MPLDLVNTLATVATLLVVAAASFAAIAQLRHMSSSNQIAAISHLRSAYDAPEFIDALRFVSAELTARFQDPEFRYQCENRSARTDEVRRLYTKAILVGDFYENMGILVKTRLVDANSVLETWNTIVVESWDWLAPFTALGRRSEGDAMWENFEYFAVLAQDWIAAHPQGTYPRGVRRIALKDEYLEADRQYAASLAPV